MAREPSSSKRLAMYSGDGPIFTPRIMRAVYRAQPSASSMMIGKLSPVVIPSGGPLLAGVEGPAFPSSNVVILSEATAGSGGEGLAVVFGSFGANGLNSTP